MRALIDYPNRPGAHCGSTAMRSLLAFYCDLDLTEAMVVGLGSAIDCLVIEKPLGALPFMSFGRGLTMESDSAAALGIGYVEQLDHDNAHAWDVVRAEVLAGRPTMLSGDTYYLGYHPSTSHFPSHRFVLVGLDDERRTAWVAERAWVEPRACPYDELAAARNPEDWPISTFNLWGRFSDRQPSRPLAEACGRAIRTTADRLLGRDDSQASLIRAMVGGADVTISSGLRGVAQLRRVLLEGMASPQGGLVAKAMSDVFERRGTGGGNFRRLFAQFLEEVSLLAPGLVAQDAIASARRSARAWTRLADCLLRFSAGASEAVGDCAAALDQIAESERSIAEALDASQ